MKSSNRIERSSEAPHLVSRRHQGFALVATLMLMVLLSILALGLLSLSSISLRTSNSSTSMMEARANARMALMIALGELQEHAGPDQRITAGASILSDPDTDVDTSISHPHWTGIWDSWKAGDPNPSGGDEPSQHATLNDSGTGMHPEYSANKSSHFRAWLASTPDGKSSDIAAVRDLTWAATLTPGAGDEAVKLVAQGSIGETGDVANHVSAALIDVSSVMKGGRGRYGWWVGDESIKASIMGDAHEGGTLSAADRIFRHQSPGSTGFARATGLETTTAGDFVRVPSLRSLDLLDGAVEPSAFSFHDIALATSGVLADVREGGLKRDLSILLEQPIKTTDNGKDHMLYSFADGIKESVPIQDLSAYYQLYQDDPNGAQGRKGGIKFGSSALPGAIQLETPDFGTPTTRDKAVREYTTLYRNPVPIKIQYVFAMTALPLDRSELVAGDQPLLNPLHTHKLVPGVMPIITLWNPNNVPLVMGGSANKAQVLKMSVPPFNLTWTTYRADGSVQVDRPFNLNYAISVDSSIGGAANVSRPEILALRFGASEAIVFEPGETKVFTIPDTGKTNLLLSEAGNTRSVTSFGFKLHDAVNEYNPYGFFTCYRSAATKTIGGKVYCYNFPTDDEATPAVFMGVGTGDFIAWKIDKERAPADATGAGAHSGPGGETHGGGFQFYLIDADNCSSPDTKGGRLSDHIRHYQFMSRFGGGARVNGSEGTNADFNGKLMSLGFRDGTVPIPAQARANSISVQSMLGLAAAGEAVPVALFTLSAGCEAHESSSGGYGAGRRVSTRPFLHGSPIASPFIDSVETNDLYNYGWDWSVERLTTLEQVIQVEPGTGRNFYGGGYTPEKGTTHFVQQEIPVLPPISIAALSHAHLGGFSLADRAVVAEVDENFRFDDWWTPSENRNPDPAGDSFRRVTAMGQGGLAPHVMQAIGNSYAHPNIPADKAFVTVGRTFDNDVGPESRIFADHSYLANKALWDEFFFSSIIPKPTSTPLHGETLTAAEVADKFFFEDKPLPNRRITAYDNALDKDGLVTLFQGKDTFTGGLADKIAGHLMVKGAFNINSTSVAAWKVVLSSLRGKPVQYLESGGSETTEATTQGTPVGFGTLPGGKPLPGSAADDPKNPEPWLSWRELTDTEIDELAAAIVKQVKLRGPFLSLSEFVNRRLDSSSSELSLKGALQAALDDPSVSINAPFRKPGRIMDSEPGVTTGTYPFKEAATGPIAYGSSAYVDQADILRNFAEQFTPRGDTFVIRTYGDSLSPNGEVMARAWCEAVVQRVPDYLDAKDANETKQADLQSPQNIRFGRKFNIVSFRWLNPNEV